jgi:hypothetical protein
VLSGIELVGYLVTWTDHKIDLDIEKDGLEHRYENEPE